MPKPPEKYTVDSEAAWKASPDAGTNTGEDQDFSAYSAIELHLITQAELNDLPPDLDLPKTKDRLVGSWLQQWNLPEKGVKVSFYGNRQRNTANYISTDDDLVYCNDICGWM
jgi:hypothetical protein